MCSTLSDLLDIHILGDLSSLDRLPGLEENEADIFSPGTNQKTESQSIYIVARYKKFHFNAMISLNC